MINFFPNRGMTPAFSGKSPIIYRVKSHADYGIDMYYRTVIREYLELLERSNWTTIATMWKAFQRMRYAILSWRPSQMGKTMSNFAATGHSESAGGLTKDDYMKIMFDKDGNKNEHILELMGEGANKVYS